MELKSVREQIAALDADTAGKARSILQLISIGGAAKPEYQRHLDLAQDWRGFFEGIYQDDSLADELAWADCAKLLHPTGFLSRFKARAVVDVPVTDGKVYFESPNGKAGFRIEAQGPIAHVHIFNDGDINEALFNNAEQCNYPVMCADQLVSGPLSAHSIGSDVVLIPWEFDDGGFRVSQKVRYCIS